MIHVLEKNQRLYAATDLGQPVTLDLRFKHYRPSQMLAYLPIVERTDAHSIRYVGEDIIAVSKFLEFVMNYQVGLEP